MITKELTENRACLFCASDYHLEMILLPYIKERLEKEKFFILTQNNLEDTIKILLNRINLDQKVKTKILNLNWNKKNISNENINEATVIINGDYDFIKKMNCELNNKNVKIIDCFHIGDRNVDIENLSKNYDYVLNTRKF